MFEPDRYRKGDRVALADSPSDRGTVIDATVRGGKAVVLWDWGTSSWHLARELQRVHIVLQIGELDA